jgi:hypothetical protein
MRISDAGVPTLRVLTVTETTSASDAIACEIRPRTRARKLDCLCVSQRRCIGDTGEPIVLIAVGEIAVKSLPAAGCDGAVSTRHRHLRRETHTASRQAAEVRSPIREQLCCESLERPSPWRAHAAPAGRPQRRRLGVIVDSTQTARGTRHTQRPFDGGRGPACVVPRDASHWPTETSQHARTHHTLLESRATTAAHARAGTTLNADPIRQIGSS